MITNKRPTKKKIVRIIARLNVGGPARHVVWLTEALQDDDFESVLIAGTVPEGEEDMCYFASDHGVEPLFIKDMSRELSVRDLIALFRIWRVLVSELPDIIHTHTAKAGTLGRIAALLYRWVTPASLVGKPRAVRVFHTFHGHIFHNYYGRLKTGLFLRIEKILAKVATNKIIVISGRQLKEVGAIYGVGSARQFSVIPLGLDLGQFAADGTAGKRFRKEIGVDDDEILVGIVGRLTEIKNHRVFIQAVRTCANESDFSRVKFVIIGDGHLRKELESLAEGTGIIFAGNLTEANMFYSALDVVALTSLNEGTPLTLIEAMAFGKPWIATAVGGVEDLAGRPVEISELRVQSSESVESNLKPGSVNPELPEAGSGGTSVDGHDPVTGHRGQCASRTHERGILFDSGDSAGLIEGLRLLVTDGQMRDTIGGRGKDFVLKDYSKERLVQDIKDLYRQDTGHQR